MTPSTPSGRPDGRAGYKGGHALLPDGRCQHKWANRLVRIVNDCPVAAVEAYRLDLAEKVRTLRAAGYIDHAFAHPEDHLLDTVLRLIEGEKTP